ncbi:MAG: FixH family protein [Myxococcales bacterium]
MMNVVESSDKGSRWVWMPVGLLLASTLGVGSLAMIAVHDPSFALEPNYYEQALHWDRTQAQAADNQRLAYQIELVPGIAVDARGNATVRVRIADASGHEPNAATVRATAFANAYAGQRAPLDFLRVGPGLYSASLSAPRLGLWEFRFVVTQGSDRITSTLRSDIVRGAG